MNRSEMTSTLPGWLRAASCACALLGAAITTPVHAQGAPAHTQESTDAQDTNAAAVASDVPEPTAFEWSLLDPPLDPATDKTLKTAPAPTSSAAGANWNRTLNNNGASAVTVKQPVSPYLDAQVGADMNVANNNPMTSGEMLARRATGDNPAMQSTGSAWANMSAPGVGGLWDKTSVEARVDPSQEQSKVGTTISKTVPLGSPSYAVTVQGSYNMIDSAAPMTGATGRATNNASQFDRSAKLEFKDTGTSLIAGESMSTVDEKWLRRIGAEQKLFGGVSVTGAVSQTVDGASSKKLTAGYKYNW